MSAASEGLGPIYLDEVLPGLNPGGLWVRICAGDELIAEHPLGQAGIPAEFTALDGQRDGLLACKAADRFGESRTYVYDGNSGACVATVIRKPMRITEG